MTFQKAGQFEAAEQAYLESLAIEVQIDEVAEQANTLGQLGNLYGFVLDRPEEAVSFYRQAIEKYIEVGDLANEGLARNNAAGILYKLRRLDEARHEIQRAIECKAQFGHAATIWKSWSILTNIEIDAGNPAPADKAKRKAIDSYLAFRRDGGENHEPIGRLFFAVTQALLAANTPLAEQAIAQYRERWKDYNNPEADALQAIVAGSRDRALADDPDLNYQMVVEILFLLETLEQHEHGQS